MFISRLTNVVEAYDPYGENRLNGVKVVYILLILYVVNNFLPIPNPYFYFFYVPITTMIAEISGQTLEEKYRLLFYCMICLNIISFYFQLFCTELVLIYYCFFIFMAIIFSSHQQSALCAICSASCFGARFFSYALLYESININIYDIINNAFTIILAMIVIFSALVCFPRSYYYRLWLRSLLLLIDQMIAHLTSILNMQRITFDPVQGHTTRLGRYANMLTPKLPIYSILKINLLIDKLHIIISVIGKDAILINNQPIHLLISELNIFKNAIKQERPCELQHSSLTLLDKLIKSWNHLCLSL